MLRPRRVGREERQVDVGLLHARQLDLGLLGRFLETLQDHLVLADVDALILLELGDQPMHDQIVDVVAAEVGVAVGRHDLDHLLADLEHRDVEGAAAEVVHRDEMVIALVETVGERRRRRLVDDALDVEAGDAPRVLGRLALRVVEVRRHRDHGPTDLLPQVVLGRLLHLLQDVRRDLLRTVVLAADAYPHGVPRSGHDAIGHHLHFFAHFLHPATHEPLDGENGVFRIGDRLSFGDLPDQELALLGEGHHGRCRSRALGIRNDDRLAALHDGND